MVSSSTPVLDQGELERAFEKSPEDGVTQLHRDFRDLVARSIKSVSRGGLSADELCDAYQETLISVLSVARRQDFDAREPLRLVMRIARFRALDALRRKVAQPTSLQLVDEPAHFDGLLGEERAEFQRAYKKSVAELSPRQQLISRLFLSHAGQLAERGRYQRIAQGVLEETGEVVSALAVKSAWRAAREKIKAGLTRAGFLLMDGSHRDET